MSKHTPGPWVYREYGGICGTNIFVVERPSHEPICTLTDNRYNGFAGEANARLIAAAPEMLALVRQVAALSQHDICTPDVARVNNFAHVLLKRIEGEIK